MQKMTPDQWGKQFSKYKTRMEFLTCEYNKKIDERDSINTRLQELKSDLHELKTQINETKDILDLLESVGSMLVPNRCTDAPDTSHVSESSGGASIPKPHYKHGSAMYIALQTLRRLGGEQSVVSVLLGSGESDSRKTQTKYRNALAKLVLDGWVVRVGSGMYRALNLESEVLEGHELENDIRTVVKNYKSVRLAIVHIINSDHARTWTIPEVARANGVTDTSNEEVMREYRSAFSYQSKQMGRIKRIDVGIYASLKYLGKDYPDKE